jgi:hypothetical protein
MAKRSLKHREDKLLRVRRKPRRLRPNPPIASAPAGNFSDHSNARRRNGQIQAEFLEAAVWREVCDLLKNPEKLEREFKEGGDADASLQTWRL